MIFAEFHIEDSRGVILAHSLRLPDRMLKKGRVLSQDDVLALRLAGIRVVVGAKLEADDIGEDEAARILAEVLAGPNTSLSPAFTGRCNIFSAVRGLAAFDRDRLERFNLVDEAVTVATLPPWEPVTPRQMVATVKIIPFAVNRHVVDACAALAAGQPLIRVEELRPHRVGLLMTHLPGTKSTILDATATVARARLAALGSTVAMELRCPHDEGAIERSLSKMLAAGCGLILISGASATVDRRDVVPSGIARLGGEIDHFGMPVDPGNLLLLAHIGTVPILDMPGCGRAAKLNGLDWVLRRLLAGQSVTSRDIMLLGVGGLLKHLPSPSAAPDDESAAPHEPRIAILVEADEPARAVAAADAALASRADMVVVVAGQEAGAVEQALADRPVALVRRECRALGAAASLKAGIAALPRDIDGALVCPADMAPVAAARLDKIIAAFDPREGRAICLPVHRGKRGDPVLLGRDFFDETLALPDDGSLRPIIEDHGELVCEVVMDEDDHA